MAIREAFLRFREALRINRRQKRQEEPEPVTKIRDLPELDTPREPRPRKLNNRKMTKARRASYAGPGLVHIEQRKRAKKEELYERYFAMRKMRAHARIMMLSSATAEIRQLGKRQYDDAEREMKRLIYTIVRV